MHVTCSNSTCCCSLVFLRLVRGSAVSAAASLLLVLLDTWHCVHCWCCCCSRLAGVGWCSPGPAPRLGAAIVHQQQGECSLLLCMIGVAGLQPLPIRFVVSSCTLHVGQSAVSGAGCCGCSSPGWLFAHCCRVMRPNAAVPVCALLHMPDHRATCELPCSTQLLCIDVKWLIISVIPGRA